jgi:hypothetical protein
LANVFYTFFFFFLDKGNLFLDTKEKVTETRNN